MKKFETTILTTVLLLMMMLVSIVQIANAETMVSADTTAKEKLPAFLTTVMSIDISKYAIPSQGYSTTYPENYGGVVKQEVINTDYTTSNSEINAMGIFYNGFVYSVTFEFSGKVAYLEQPSTSILDRARNILTRYYTFATTYGLATAHLASASNMLSRVNTLSPSNTTVGNMKLMITSTTVTEPGVDIVANITRLIWIYSENGIDAPMKCLSLEITETETTKICFADTWGLYTVASTGASKSEVTNIAWVAAKNYNLTAVGIDNSTVTLCHGWSNRTETALSMVPGQIYNNSLNAAVKFATMGSAVREPLSLYPLWQYVFYFDASIDGAIGIQVGVWGDTKEVAYCSTFGYYGEPTTVLLTPEPTTAPESPANGTTIVIVLIAIACVSALVAISGYVARRKK